MNIYARPIESSVRTPNRNVSKQKLNRYLSVRTLIFRTQKVRDFQTTRESMPVTNSAGDLVFGSTVNELGSLYCMPPLTRPLDGRNTISMLAHCRLKRLKQPTNGDPSSHRLRTHNTCIVQITDESVPVTK